MRLNQPFTVTPTKNHLSTNQSKNKKEIKEIKIPKFMATFSGLTEKAIMTSVANLILFLNV
jgi:hypothetical protein